MRTLLSLSLLLASHSLVAQESTGGDGSYQCPITARTCITTPPITIGNPDGFDWQGVPPDGGLRTPYQGLQRSQTSFPSQVINGGFNNNSGWDARQYYANGSVSSTLYGLGETHTGTPPPAGGITYSPNILDCPGYGTIAQKLHVGSNKTLTFDWRAGVVNPNSTPPLTYRGVNLQLNDAYTGRALSLPFGISYSVIGNNNRTTVDLSAYAGLDIEVVYRTDGCSSALRQPWVDSVSLVNGAAPTFSGTATPGNWYNPSRSGSGWDLRRAPDGSYYAIWYTYDTSLQPIWYITHQSNFVNGRFQAALMKCTRTGTTAACPTVGRVDLTLKSSTQGEMRFDFANEGTPGLWDGEEFFTLLAPAGGNYSGHFHSNDASDPAWGINSMSFTEQNQQKLFVSVYYYNGSEPTWAVGTRTVETPSTTLQMMRQFGGLCPQCVGTFPAITQQAVGYLNMAFTGSSPELYGTMYFTDWSRPSRPFFKLAN